MGLDMYATRRHFVKQFCHPEAEQYSVVVTKDGQVLPHIRPERISYVEEDVMTWRKAYHIHNWFVENVQDGKDDGAMYRIPDGKLKELFKACDHVLLTGKLVAGTVKHIEFNGKHPGGTSISEPAMVLKDDAIARSYFHCPGGKWGVCPQYDSKFFEEIHATWLWLSEVIRELDDGTSDGIYYYAR